MTRGQLYRVKRPADDPKRARVFVVVSRQGLIASRFSQVICAPIYSRSVGVMTEVAVGPDEGLKHDSVIVCDNLTSIAKQRLTDYVGTLSPAKLLELKAALRVALAVE